jgi:amidohydrolase
MTSDADLRRIRTALDAELLRAVDLRRRLHEMPDLSGDEGPTLQVVLDAMPAALTATPVADTGAVVRVGDGGPAVGVRGELDALAVTEDSGLAWASRRAGVMHACGHDVHLAALVALVRAVHVVGGPVPLLAVLQPREETYPSGASDIADSGILEAERCAVMIGAHVQPTLPGGVVSCTPGAVNASADEFTVTVHGRGGHAAYPHLTRDPVVALAHVVVAVQSVVSRSVDPMSSAVVTVSTLAAGAAPNVVPGHAVARGILRAMSDQDRALLHARLCEVASAVAEANGCTAEVAIERGEPVLENDAGLAASARGLLSALGLRPDSALRSMGSDDFAFFSARMPALMSFVGVGRSAGLHSPAFAPGDDSVRHVAYAMLAGYLAGCSMC